MKYILNIITIFDKIYYYIMMSEQIFDQPHHKNNLIKYRNEILI